MIQLTWKQFYSIMFMVTLLGAATGWVVAWLQQQYAQARARDKSQRLNKTYWEVDEIQRPPPSPYCEVPGCKMRVPHDHLAIQGALSPTRKCPVAGCQVQGPHSHLRDFLRRVQGK